ncbi:MAG: hypothetical protein U9N73_04860, partial [Candidatus Auribacterota bacterium]|nr:hypothetical protein [Candidatus Auribacterota bacterium]
AALIFIHFMDEDNLPKRYAYFQKYISRACLGTIAARVPLSGDNAIFFRYGLPYLLPSFIDGEKYLHKHPEKKNEVDNNLIGHLNSWRRKKHAQAVFRVLFNR